MEKTELLACPLTDAEIIHIFENSRLQSEHFAQEAVTAAYVAALAALNHRTPSPDNMKTALLPLEFVFGHGAFGVGSVSEDENASIREIIVYRLPNPVLPAGTTLGDVGKHVEEMENVLVRMRFESVESAHVFERSVSRVLDSFGETDNCTNAECPYQNGVPCPAADGCGGFVPDNKPLTVEAFEEVCESVHNGWWEEKTRQGCTEHPDMIAYASLTESVKEYDRVTVRRVLDALGVAYHHPPP